MGSRTTVHLALRIITGRIGLEDLGEDQLDRLGFPMRLGGRDLDREKLLDRCESIILDAIIPYDDED